MKVSCSLGVVVAASLGIESVHGFTTSDLSGLTCKHQALHASVVVDASTTAIEDSEDSVDFPPPLSAVDRLTRAATFWSTAIPIVANYYGLIGSIKLQEILGENQTDEDIEVRS